MPRSDTMAIPGHSHRLHSHPSRRHSQSQGLAHRPSRGATTRRHRAPSSLVYLACALPLLPLLALLALAPLCRAQCDVGINYSVQYGGQSLDVGTSLRILRGAGFKSIKTFGQNTDVFNALAGTSTELILGVYPKEATTTFANDQGAADDWVRNNVLPWVGRVNITTLAVANEIIALNSVREARSVVPGMWALYRSLKSQGLEKRIKIQTPQHPGFIAEGYPPSTAYVQPRLQQVFADLLDFVTKTGSALSITAYLFWSMRYHNMSLDYAFGRGLNGFYDNGLYYQNNFDAIIDSALVAAEKLGYSDVDIQVGEAGWPTKGDWKATLANAEQYNKILLGKLCSGQGTPKRPGKFFRTWLFEAFDEEWKAANGQPWEAAWGLWTWDGRQKYDLDVTKKYPAPPVSPGPGPNPTPSIKPSNSPSPSPSPPPTSPAAQKWCVVKRGSDSAKVQGYVDWACSQGGVNCGDFIKYCTSNKAAAIYNMYFQINKQGSSSCTFGGTGTVTTTNPFSAKKMRCLFPGNPP